MVYRDSYSRPDSFWHRVLEVLSASFRIGRFFGVEVRMYWVALLVMPLIFMSELDMTFGRELLSVVLLTVALYFIIYSHEMGHILWGRRYRISTPLITLSPLGGVAHMSAPAPGPRQEALVALAGPAVHLVWLAVLAPLYFGLGPKTGIGGMMLSFLWGVNLSLMLFNLLPFFPMDGGRVLRSVLAAKMHANKASLIVAKIGMVGSVLLAIAGLFVGGFGAILFFIGLNNFFACRREVQAAQYGDGPYGPVLEAWQSDPDAWKAGGEDVVLTPSKKERSPGPLARWSERRREQRRQRAEREDEDLKAQADRVLERVSEVGEAGLTKQEREILMKASEAMRRSKGG